MPLRLISIFTALLLSLPACADNAKLPQIKKIIQTFSAKLGQCDCSGNALDREAGEKPLGTIAVRDLHDRAFNVAVMNDEFALKIFQEMTVQGKIPFGYPEDGCYARAHEMSRMLEKKGVLTGKVFATGVFRVENEKATKGAITWGFHVAPFVVVDDGKTKMFWVIDPSLFYEPATLESWLATLTAHPKSELDKVFLTTRFIYHPRQRDRVLSEFDPEDLKSSNRVMKKYLRTDFRRSKRPLEGD